MRFPFRKTEQLEELDDSDAPDASATDAGGEWIAYELHTWAQESRSMTAQLLVADGVPHSWQGTTLMVHETSEQVVDELLEEVQMAGRRSIDPDATLTAFEMKGWDDALLAVLGERLTGIGVPHEFDDDGDLVVHEIDEEQVEMVIDEVLTRREEHDLEQLEGLEANDLLSALFLAVDRLRRDAGHPGSVNRVIEHASRLIGAAAPFGFDPAVWGSLRDASAALLELIEAEQSDIEEISEQAAALGETLRGMV